jgi:hypothetical protein
MIKVAIGKAGWGYCGLRHVPTVFKFLEILCNNIVSDAGNKQYVE